MIKEIKSNYKGIFIHLNNLADVNYFVGKNGCGKTRLLEAINEYASCLRNKITSDFTKIKFDK